MLLATVTGTILHLLHAVNEDIILPIILILIALLSIYFKRQDSNLFSKNISAELTIMTFMLQTANSILEFWFAQATPKQWWSQSDTFDRLIEARFGNVHAAAECCEKHQDHHFENFSSLKINLVQSSQNLSKGTVRHYC